MAAAHAARASTRSSLPPEQDAALWDYLERAAYFMVNTLDEA